MATEKKMTKVDALNVALAALEDYPHERLDEVIEKIQGIILQLQKKNSATSGKLTPKQMENEVIKANILAYMVEDTNYTISDLLKHVADLPEDMTNQRMNALLRQMYPDPKHPEIPVSACPIVRVEVKGKAHFALNPDFVPAEDGEDEDNEVEG